MKVTSVEVHPENSASVAVLNYKDVAGQSPYTVRSIDGLDAQQIVARAYLGSDIVQNDLAMLNRNIDVQIDLNPDFDERVSYSDLRDALYKLIWSGRLGQITLQFKDGATTVATISGVVQKFETVQFSKKQAVKLSIFCDQPMLRGLARTNVYVSDLLSRHFTITDGESNAPHGLQMKLTMRRPVASLLIGAPHTDMPEGISLLMNPTAVGGFQEGDLVFLSSEFGDKYLYIVRGGENLPIVDSIQFNSSWPLIFPGPNDFFIKDRDHMSYDVAEINTLSYYPTYWGV
jgi:hypothetical protein